jgi:hypothetical protein
MRFQPLLDAAILRCISYMTPRRHCRCRFRHYADTAGYIAITLFAIFAAIAFSIHYDYFDARLIDRPFSPPPYIDIEYFHFRHYYFAFATPDCHYFSHLRRHFHAAAIATLRHCRRFDAAPTLMSAIDIISDSQLTLAAID